MTINIALTTSSAVVFGCDSIASVSQPLLDPWATLQRDAHGVAQTDEEGRVTAKFRWGDVKTVVTQVFGGVTKVFELCNAGARVAATTSGLAALSGKSMENLAADFCRQIQGQHIPTVAEVAQRFVDYMHQEYDAYYGVDYPDHLKDELEFLLGGYGEGAHFPEIHRVNVRANTAAQEYGAGEFGISWSGQADGVARLLFGYDRMLQRSAHRVAKETIDGMYEAFSTATASILQNTLQALGSEMPEGVDVALPEKPDLEFSWREFQLDIECQNLPMQDAIDLVSYLVYVQAGRAKFVRGVPTVGGRIRVGYITRTTGFKLLNEPELVHRITGFPAQL